MTRLSVNLNARSAEALKIAMRLTGDTATDTVNRALQLYAYVEQASEKGGSIFIRETGDLDELKEVRIL